MPVKKCDGFVTGLKEVRRYGLGIAMYRQKCQTVDVSQKEMVGNRHGGTTGQG